MLFLNLNVESIIRKLVNDTNLSNVESSDEGDCRLLPRNNNGTAGGFQWEEQWYNTLWED